MNMLSGGGRAYMSLNVELIKPSPTSYSTSNSTSRDSSPSIFPRKSRTPRKRPNQTYNEAAAILSSAHPKIFPLTKPFKFTTTPSILSHPPDLLMPLLPKPIFSGRRRGVNSVQKGCRNRLDEEDSHDYGEGDFSAESMLEEEMEEGIDSIMGKESSTQMKSNTGCSGFPVGLGFGCEYGMRRDVDEGDWWRFPSQNIAMIPVEKEKKKSRRSCEQGKRTAFPAIKTQKLFLKLNYDDVLKAWSDKGSPFAEVDVQERLAHIDLFLGRGRGANKTPTKSPI